MKRGRHKCALGFRTVCDPRKELIQNENLYKLRHVRIADKRFQNISALFSFFNNGIRSGFRSLAAELILRF
jgi:hypothetical protein